MRDFPFRGPGTRFQVLKRRRTRDREKYRLPFYEVLAFVFLLAPPLILSRNADPIVLWGLVEEYGLRKVVPDPRVSRQAPRLHSTVPQTDYRFTNEQILELCDRLRLPEFIRTASGHVVARRTALEIVLMKLASKVRFKKMISIFNLGKGELSEIYLETINLIDNAWARPLLETFNFESLDEDKIEEFIAAIARKDGALPGVWAFMDGKFLEICRPSLCQKEFYNKYYKAHGLKFLIVVSPDGIIRLCHGPHLGKRHDARIFRMAGVQQQLENHFGDPFQYGDRAPKIFADTAFPLSSYVFRGFKAALGRIPAGDPRRVFNTRMSSIRIAVEWSIGYVTQLWAGLDNKKDLRILASPVGQLFRVAVFLTNCYICMNPRESQIAGYFLMRPPSIQEYLSGAR